MKKILENYLLTDLVLLGFLISVVLLIIGCQGIGNTEYHSEILKFSGFIAFLLIILPYWKIPRSNKFLSFIRLAFPLLITSLFFKNIENLFFVVFQDYLDDYILVFEKAVFLGLEPAVLLSSFFPQKIFGEIMSFFYTSYYFQVLVLIFWAFRNNKDHFYRITFGLTLGFYVCYFIYIVFPVQGPLHFMQVTLDNQFQGYFFAGFLKKILANGDIPGAAFPSSHCSISLMCTIYTFKYVVRLRWIYLIITCGLFVSTMYLKQHYGVDVIAGMFVAIGFFFLCEWLYLIWITNQDPITRKALVLAHVEDDEDK